MKIHPSLQRIRIRHRKDPAAAGFSAADLELALVQHRVTILVQPQVDLSTGELAGVETLARVIGADGRLVPPAEFIPLAERTGLIRPLGRRIFALACDAACQLAAAGRGDLRVAINLSPLQLADPAEVGILLGILAGSPVNPHQLEIEITETAAIRTSPRSIGNCSASAGSACRSRSTTSAPVSARSPTCWSSTSTGSRSTASSSRRSARAAVPAWPTR